jgi:formamidopyrimidine-DNA glycosylase
MPELPEVESARRAVEKAVRGRRIVAVRAVPDPVIFGRTRPSALATALVGRRVLRLGRHGKHLWLELDGRPWLAVHFGMTGWLKALAPGEALPRSCKLEIDLTGGRRIVYTDPRRFGRVRLLQDPRAEPPISLLGPDPLSGLPPAPVLEAQLARRGAPIKAVLLDQSLFAGVGNWVADEVLYQARLSPHRPARSLSAAQVRTLRAAVLRVLRTAVAVDADSERFPRGWLFHHRWGRRAESRTAGGDSIVHETIGGRTAAWAPARQR